MAVSDTPVNAWLRIGSDNTITILVGQSEMGQGVYTGLPMFVAEELEADWSKIKVEFATPGPAYVDPTFGNQQVTGGSRSTIGWHQRLRVAGAQAREVLRMAAAQRWKADVSECSAVKGEIIHTRSGRRSPYGDLVATAVKLTPPPAIPLKEPKDWQILGTMVHQLDSRVKSAANAIYGIDAQVPGMLHGTVIACPVFGGRLKRVDDAKAKQVSGFHSVVRTDNAVIVLADGYWPAKQAADLLDLEWDPGEGERLSSESLRRDYTAGLDEPGVVAMETGARASADRTITSIYEAPYIAHATMEPMNALVHVTDSKIDVWASTQVPTGLKKSLSKMYGLPEEQIHLHPAFLGGGFGRRGEVDYVIYAAQASKASGRPAKIVWSREEDMRHGFYRPMATARLSAGLSAAGALTSLDIKLVTQSIGERLSPGQLKNGIDYHFALTGLDELKYRFPYYKLAYVRRGNVVPTGAVRAIGSGYTGYFLEGFIDEIAQAAGKDPLQFRRELLAGEPRHLAVLDALEISSRWRAPLPPGTGRGLALYGTIGTIVALAVEAEVKEKEIRVKRATAVIDCGWATNPNGVVAQMESSIIFGLSAALYQEITIDGGRAVEGNFDTFPMARMADTPPIDVKIINSGAALGGVGEPAIPVVAPALANAIFAATGKRLRSMPFNGHQELS